MIAEGPKEQAKRSSVAIGEFIREQREQAQVSLRQLSRLAGVSNPYLSQIERGLRKPSAEILQQIANGLRISADQLYIRAGILEAREGNGELIGAILADERLAERQKQVLIDIYESFCRENDRVGPGVNGSVNGSVDRPAGPPTVTDPPSQAATTTSGSE